MRSFLLLEAVFFSCFLGAIFRAVWACPFGVVPLPAKSEMPKAIIPAFPRLGVGQTMRRFYAFLRKRYATLCHCLICYAIPCNAMPMLCYAMLCYMWNCWSCFAICEIVEVFWKSLENSLMGLFDLCLKPLGSCFEHVWRSVGLMCV